MKLLLVTFMSILCAFASGIPTRSADPAQEAIDFLKGFFKGALEDQSVEIETCIGDASAVVTVIEKIIADVEANAFTHLDELFLNFVDLLADSIEDFKAKDFNGSESIIEDILNVLLIQISSVNSADDAAFFIKAFYKSAFSISLQLDECKEYVGKAWDDIVFALNMIRQGKIGAGVSALFRATADLLVSFKTCKTSWPQIEEGLDQLHTFVDHPTFVIVAISKAVMSDPLNFIKDIYKIHDAFTSNPWNFGLGGEASGEIIKMVLQYMPYD